MYLKKYNLVFEGYEVYGIIACIQEKKEKKTVRNAQKTRKGIVQNEHSERDF